jgi:hypothetical protein
MSLGGQWLLRKRSDYQSSSGGNESITPVRVVGPLGLDEVKKLVQAGELEADDELCAENGYWFALHEISEVKKHLGLERIVFKNSLVEDEVTQPDLVDEVTQPDLTPPTTMIKVTRLGPAATAGTSPHFDEPTPPAYSTLPTGNAAAQQQNPNSAKIEIRSVRVESSRVWGILILLCSALAVIGFLWVLKSLRPE